MLTERPEVSRDLATLGGKFRGVPRSVPYRCLTYEGFGWIWDFLVLWRFNVLSSHGFSRISHWQRSDLMSGWRWWGGCLSCVLGMWEVVVAGWGCMFWRIASCRTFTPGIDLSHKGWIFLRFPRFFFAVQKEMTRGMAKLSGVVPGPWSQGKREHFGLRHVASNVPWWIEVAGASAASACQGSGIQGREMVDLFCVFFPDSAEALFGSWNLHRWDASMLLM